MTVTRLSGLRGHSAVHERFPKHSMIKPDGRSRVSVQICDLGVLAVAWTRLHGLLLGGSADSSTEREFPSDKIYRRNDRGIVGVESFSPQPFLFLPPYDLL